MKPKLKDPAAVAGASSPRSDNKRLTASAQFAAESTNRMDGPTARVMAGASSG